MSTERDWRIKYREALARLEAEEARATKLREVLRLLIGRLCLAAEGRNPRLDQELTRVSNTVRKSFEVDDLDKLIEPLSQVVAALDTSNSGITQGLRPIHQTAAAAPSAAPAALKAPADEAASLPLLDRLALLPELRELVTAM